MAISARLRDAAGHLNAGRDAEAAEACEAAMREAGEDAAALHLLGVALTRQGRAGEALPRLRRAVELAPASAAAWLALGNASRDSGDAPAARDAYERALSLEPANVAARFRLAEALVAAGAHAAAARHFGRIARANPMDFEAVQRFIDCVARDAASASARHADRPARDALGTVTIGMCTVDRPRAEIALASLRRALAPATVAVDLVEDAASLAEAYNRILERAAGDVVILCHDDIEILDASIHEALARALASADLVGVAGADRVTGPAVLWAGHPHLHGRIAYPREEGTLEATTLSLRRGLVNGLQSLDGVLLALGPRARALRFDAATFDGFHFYDLDFTYRAHLAGLRLAATTDIALLHRSEGRFDDAWRRYGERFVAKFPALDAPAGAPHWYGARFRDVASVLAFQARLDAAIAGLEAAP